jgi:ubiquinone/menaquinone biosynthesis C-methylase UbiE
MSISKLQKNWNEFGKTDPLWAILTSPEKKGNKWEVDEFFKTGLEEVEAILSSLEQYNINIPKAKALDFGCGVGRLTQALAHYFDEVYGVDIAPSMIELAQKYNKYGNKCKYILNETDNLKMFPENNFNFIYTNLVLQHMKPKYSKRYIKEFLRILLPNGLLIFQIPSERRHSENPVRKMIRHIIPSSILDWIFYLRIDFQTIFKREPKMEMYGIRKEEIAQLLQKNRGKIVDIKQDQSDHSVWISLKYYVTK